MRERIGCGIALGVIALLWPLFPAQSLPAQTNQNAVVASFRQYIQNYLGSYKTDNRKRATLLGGGWVNEKYEPSSDYAIDVQTTNSLVSPYLGICTFTLTRRYTGFHKSREEAAKDDNFIQADETKHRHQYAFQDNSWVPKTREHFTLDKWYDCNEVIYVGPNAGESNLFGCWELPASASNK